MRLLIATDGSHAAQATVDLVASRSWSPDLAVRLLAVDDTYGASRDRLEACVEAAAGQLEAAGIKTETQVSAGRAATTLLAGAASWAADLIAVGRRGRGRIESLVLGSVSAEIVERATASVLVVRRPRIDAILVAVDGSPVSRSVAPFLCATGAFDTCPALVVSVSREADPWPPNLDLIAARAATRAAEQLARCGVDARRELLVGEPAAMILSRAADDDADLIAVGSRGLSRVRQLLIGSVARNVAWSALANVLIVRRWRGTAAERGRRR